MFKDITLKTEYRSGKNNVVKEFFNPLLSQAVLYQRAVGFFSSSALVQMASGISDMIKNGGRIQLIVSPRLQEEDIIAIQAGYKDRESVIAESIMREFTEPKTYFEAEKLNWLATLIANGKLDIKVAFTTNKNQIGIYHEKMGLIHDSENNIVAFSGSTNETATAFNINYEVVDVFCSWQSDFEKRKVSEKETAFESLWSNADPSVNTIEFPKVAREKLQSYKKDDIDLGIEAKEYEETVEENNAEKTRFLRIPNGIELRNYQKEAINKWIKNNGCGIFDMATGTGKTFTGLGAVTALSEQIGQIALIIVCPQMHLVEQWAVDVKQFNILPIIGHSQSEQKQWKKYLKDTVTAFNLGIIKQFCFICTNSSFMTDYVSTTISKLKKNVVLVVDEAHNFGAENLSTYLNVKFKYRLALSATLERHMDDEGTNKLLNYFGEKCITYTLERAIKEKALAKYKYYPIIVTLNNDEYSRYIEITLKIVKAGGGSPENVKNKEYIKYWLIERSRIVAGAAEKLDALKKVISNRKDERHMLIYCGTTYVNEEKNDESIEVKQISAVCKMLNHDLGIKTRKYTASESAAERELIKKDFVEGNMLQAIAAIRCLDEGVNIPCIRTAFILASSTNPKEYIQRRGRVLRNFDGKEYATIYDFITIPRDLEEVKNNLNNDTNYELSLIDKELTRMKDFADMSMNPIDSDEIKRKIMEAYRMYTIQIGGRIDD